MTEADGTKLIREDKHHVYVKRQMRIYAMWPSFFFTCCWLFIISTPTLVVSNNFLSIRIVLSCFYLLIFYFEKFSTWIWYMLFAIYMKLKRYSTVKILQDSKPVTMELYWAKTQSTSAVKPLSSCVDHFVGAWMITWGSALLHCFLTYWLILFSHCSEDLFCIIVHLVWWRFAFSCSR